MLPLSKVTISAPSALNDAHDFAQFDCGVQPLNDWLRKRALKSQLAGSARVFAACQGNMVIGYYCLAMGAVFHDAAAGKAKRNMPDPVPVVLLGRLAVDRNWANKGIGAGLLKDGVNKALQASQLTASRAMLVHAKDENAKSFYEKFGFRPSPVSPLTLMVALDDIRKVMGLP